MLVCINEDVINMSIEDIVTSLNERLEELHEQGRTNEILRGTKGLTAEIHGWRAWAFYRQEEYEKAKREARKANDNKVVIKCLAAIAAYVEKNQDLVKYYTDQLPDGPAKDNAKTIVARKLDDNTSKKEVIKRAEKWLAIPEIFDPLNTANLSNNTARWLLEKGEGDDDLTTALRFTERAVELYGDGDYNLHHRASTHYWKSRIIERLFDKKHAIVDAETSVYLWEKQLAIDPDNKHFQNSLAGAKKRLEELQE